MKIFSVQNSYSNMYNKNLLRKDTVQQTSPDASSSVTDSSEIVKTYAMTAPNFKSSKSSSFSYELILTDEIREPRIKVKLSNNNNIDYKNGFYSVYSFAMNDQMFEELNKNPDIKDRGSYIRPDGRCLDIRCSQEDLIPTLRLIKSKFIDAEIDPKHLEEAKMLAPIGLSLDRKINESPSIYYDLPTEISEEDYEKYAKTFTMEDLDKYNKEVLKNTDKELCLYSNRKFYEENKEEIEEIIKNWF